MKIITLNNLIPSYIMKLISWHDVEGLDEDAQEGHEPDESLDEEDDEDELEEVASHVQNQVLQD